MKVDELMGRELEKFGDMGKEKEGTAINVEQFWSGGRVCDVFCLYIVTIVLNMI